MVWALACGDSNIPLIGEWILVGREEPDAELQKKILDDKETLKKVINEGQDTVIFFKKKEFGDLGYNRSIKAKYTANYRQEAADTWSYSDDGKSWIKIRFVNNNLIVKDEGSMWPKYYLRVK
jgi:hypothetical protein